MRRRLAPRPGAANDRGLTRLSLGTCDESASLGDTGDVSEADATARRVSSIGRSRPGSVSPHRLRSARALRRRRSDRPSSPAECGPPRRDQDRGSAHRRHRPRSSRCWPCVRLPSEQGELLALLKLRARSRRRPAVYHPGAWPMERRTLETSQGAWLSPFLASCGWGDIPSPWTACLPFASGGGRFSRLRAPSAC